MTRPEIIIGLKQCLASLDAQAREVPNQRSWSPAEKLVVTLSIKHEYESVLHAIKELSNEDQSV